MEEQGKKFEVDMNDLIVKVYNKVAIWHNEDNSPEEKQMELKSVSHEIVSMVLSESFSQMEGVKLKEGIAVGRKGKRKFLDFF